MNTTDDQPRALLVTLHDALNEQPPESWAAGLDAIRQAGCLAVMDQPFLLCLPLHINPQSDLVTSVRAACKQAWGESIVDEVHAVELAALQCGQMEDVNGYLARYTPVVGNLLRFVLMDLTSALLDMARAQAPHLTGLPAAKARYTGKLPRPRSN